MYAASHFREERPGVLIAAAREIGFALVVTRDLQASHLPIFVSEEETGLVLEAHVARPNPLWRAEGPAMAVFQGPQAYVSPGWYPTKNEHGKAVPTWNYAVVHFHGQLEAIDDEGWLLGHLDRLSRANEAFRPEPWTIHEAPEGYIEGLTKAIVGLRLRVERMEGSWKMSQNQPEVNRLGVVEGLAERAPEVSALVKSRS